MKLKEVIEILEAATNPAVPRPYGLGRPNSYRGDYADLAFSQATNITVDEMLAHARSAIDATFEGYKGGQYTMTLDSEVYLADWGVYRGDEDVLPPSKLHALLDLPEAAVTKRIWSCKIGETVMTSMPKGADGPMRAAVSKAFKELTGFEPDFVFSGWNAELTTGEREVVDNAPAREEPLYRAEAAAWLMRCRGPGIRSVYATIDPNDQSYLNDRARELVNQEALYTREELLKEFDDVRRMVEKVGAMMDSGAGVMIQGPGWFIPDEVMLKVITFFRTEEARGQEAGELHNAVTACFRQQGAV